MRHRLRITQVVHYFHPLVGGIETYASTIARGLAERGHHVKVYTSRVPQVPVHEVWHGIHIYRLPSITRPLPYPLIPSLVPALIRDQCDIIHAHINSPMTVEIAAIASQLTGTPLVVTYHADALITDLVERPAYLHRRISQVYWLSRHIVAHTARRLIVTSPLYLEISSFLQRYRSKTVVIPAAVDPIFLSPLLEAGKAKEQIGYQKEDQLILFVGRLVPYKGLFTLLQALRPVLKHNPHAQLAIVGSGPQEPYLRQAIHKLRIDKAVRFLGRLSHETLLLAYSACDLFVLPSRSRSEAFGIVLLEAMARGKPVVATRVGGISYVVPDGKAGLLVPPNDPSSLASAIIRLLEDPALRRRMGRAGRLHVQNNFSLHRIISKLEELYWQLV